MNSIVRCALAPGVLAAGLAGLGLPARAEIVYVTACVSDCASTTVCGRGANPDLNAIGQPVYLDEGGFGAYSSAQAAAADKVVVPGARYHSNSFSNATPALGITLSPSLSETGGVYKVLHLFSSTANNISTNLIVGLTNVEGCTLSVTNTDRFQRRYGQPSPQTWQFLCYLTNHPDTRFPRLRFYFVDGTVSAGAQSRLVIEQFKFVSACCCLEVPPVAVTGPLATNRLEVPVAGVSVTATRITVYQDSGGGMVPIGWLTNGLVAGLNAVPVNGLVKGAKVVATQTINGSEGCRPPDGIGVVVGGGANPRIRLALSIRENPTATGPVGADGGPGANANLHFIPATSVLTGSCPGEGALVLYPGNEWQTVSVLRGDTNWPAMHSIMWSPVAGNPDSIAGDWGVLDGIAFASDDETDTGPFDLYIDNLANGTNGVFQDFETFVADTPGGAVFNQPSYSSITADHILTRPNEARISNGAADTGTKSIRVGWQFVSAATNKWLRFTTYAASAMPNPLVYLNEPVSFRILLLPVNATPRPPPPPSLQVNLTGGQVVLDWPGAHCLQTSPRASGPYTNVPGVTLGPWVNTFTDGARFFRLQD